MRWVAAAVAVLVLGPGALTRDVVGRTPPAAAAVPAPVAPAPDRLAPFRGLGTWVSGYDFARDLAPVPPVTARTTMFMQQRGVQTLYLQAAMRSRSALVSTDRLGALLVAAHQRGIKVVAWYLPTFTDSATDWRHVAAMIAFRSHGQGFDGIGLDIEDTDVPVGLRDRRLVALSRRTRARTDLPLAAIVLPPVLSDVIHPTYWGGSFPWHALRSSYDVWIPMGYYTAYTDWPRWRNAATSTSEDIRRVRAHLGAPVPVAYAGGLAADSTGTDLRRFRAAARSAGSVGESLYDWTTTPHTSWAALRGR